METGHLVTVLFGLCFVAAGFYAYGHMGRFIESAREASGIVVEVVYATGSRNSRMHPVVRYTTNEGREVMGRSRQHHNAEVGERLPLLYDPADPEHIEIGTWAQAQKWRRVFTAMCVGFGALISFVGIGLGLGTAAGAEGDPMTQVPRASHERTGPHQAVPPLSHQIAHVDSIVLSTTESSGGAVSHRVQEVWKGANASAAAGRSLLLDTRMHELLGHRPANGPAVVLFLIGDGARPPSPLEVLPVVDGSVLYSPHDTSVQEKLTLAQLKERVMAAAMPLRQNLPADGVRIALRASYIGIKRVPLIALTHNNAAPLLVLFEDRFLQRVIFRKERRYSQIEFVDVSRTDTDNLEIAYRNSWFTFTAKLARDDLPEVLRFFARKGAALGEGAQRRLADAGDEGPARREGR